VIAEDRTHPRESERARGRFAAPAKAFQGKARVWGRRGTKLKRVYITFDKTYHAVEILLHRGGVLVLFYLPC
jgi:hypothetical protein